MKVTIGIWIDQDTARNEREIASAIALARRYSNVNAIVVGNETSLRVDLLGDARAVEARRSTIKGKTREQQNRERPSKPSLN